MPSRVIRGEINNSNSLSRVSIEAELTFRSLLLAVDDFGRMDARPGILKASLFPIRDTVTAGDVWGWIEELAADEDPTIILYEHAGRPYLYLPKWEAHRAGGKRGTNSKYPAPPGVEEPESDPGVYFVRSGSDGPIKIGFTQSMCQRMAALRTTVPNLEVVAFLPDEGRAAEKRLHRQFVHLRVDREWFKPEKELLEWVASNGQPWAMPNTAYPTEGRRACSEGRGTEGECPSNPAPPDPPEPPRDVAKLAGFIGKLDGEPDEKLAWLESGIGGEILGSADAELPADATPKQRSGRLQQITMARYRTYLKSDRPFKGAGERKRISKRISVLQAEGVNRNLPTAGEGEPQQDIGRLFQA